MNQRHLLENLREMTCPRLSLSMNTCKWKNVLRPWEKGCPDKILPVKLPQKMIQNQKRRNKKTLLIPTQKKPWQIQFPNSKKKSKDWNLKMTSSNLFIKLYLQFLNSIFLQDAQALAQAAQNPVRNLILTQIPMIPRSLKLIPKWKKKKKQSKFLIQFYGKNLVKLAKSKEIPVMKVGIATNQSQK